MSDIHKRHLKRMYDVTRARNMIRNLSCGAEGAYTYLLRRGWSVEASMFIVFGEIDK